MTTIKLSSLQLEENLLQKLSIASIHSIKDLFLKSPLELMKILNCSLCKANTIIDTILHKASNTDLITAQSLNTIQDNSCLLNLDLNSDYFDKFVYENQIFNHGFISEICGAPGSGKTQFSIQLCIESFITSIQNSKFSSSIYIDTESTFSPRRSIEIAKYRFSLKNVNECYIEEFSKRLSVFKCQMPNDLERILEQIQYYITMNNVKLIIIDSIASVIKRGFSENNRETTLKRANFLTSISTILRELAYYFNISIVVINQITSKADRKTDDDIFDESINECLKSGLNEEYISVAALGNSWSHSINIRLILQYANDIDRELLIAKSPISPFKKYYYKITQNGLIVSGFNQVYEGTDCNMQRIKTKPFAKIL